ncbi:hypothetical protein H0H92_004197 [Tricholoma furcatifolium]|nr:hypothetical protein H0H92_004197 [Tricholoma furcatifolium]
MATMTMTRPLISSPLAGASSNQSTTTQQILPQRSAMFPTSRALRPFPTVAHALRPTPGKKPPVKLIEPPTNYKGTFVLDLTQAEFSRQD